MFEKTTQRWRRLIGRRIRRRPLLPFLLAATAALDMVAANLGGKGWLPFIFGQAALIGVWAGSLRGGAWLRIPTALLASIACAAAITFGPPLSETALVVVGFTAVIAALRMTLEAGLFAARRLLRIRIATPQHPYRYSVGGLLAATTLVAIAAALLAGSPFSAEYKRLFFLVAVVLAPLPIVASLFLRTRSLRFGPIAACLVLAFINYLVTKKTLGLAYYGESGFLMYSVTIGAWLLGLRVRGVTGRTPKIAAVVDPPRLDIVEEEKSTEPIDFRA